MMESTTLARRERASNNRSYSWMTAILFWCGLVIVSSNYLTIPLITLFTEAFHISPATAAWSGSAFSFFYALGSLLSGPLSDRLGRKQVMLIGLAILAVITIAIGLVQGIGVMIVLRSIQGLVAASFAPVAISYIVDKFPAQRIVTAIGFVSSGFLMSGIIGQVASQYVSQQYGWQSVFYVFGGVYLLTAVLMMRFIPSIKTQQMDGLKSMVGQFGRVLKKKALQRSYIITVSLLLCFVGMYTALGSFLTTNYGLNEQEILAFRAAGIIGMLFTPFAGRLAAVFGLQRVLRGGLALSVLGMALIGTVSNLILLTVMSVVFVTGIALTVPTLISLIGQQGGADHGAAVSIYAFVLFIGTSIGPVVATALLQTGSYLITFLGFALLLAVSLCISFMNMGIRES